MSITYKNIEAKMYHHKEWVVDTNPTTLKTNYEEKLNLAGFKILQFNEHFFPEKGYTCFWLLAESHLAIHTFPENNTTYIELTSCSEKKLNQFLGNE